MKDHQCEALTETLMQQIGKYGLSGRVGEVLCQPGLHASFPFPASGALQEVVDVFGVM